VGLTQRVLVLDQDGDGERFLADAVQLCHERGATPIVLSVAVSERAARNRQARARAALGAAGLPAEFDLLASLNTQSAVAQVARWRRCPVVLVGRPTAAPWWRRWWRGARDRADGLAWVTLAEAGLADAETAPEKPAAVSWVR
jgi:K+-sensing histidine kinase KdpD